MLAFLCAYIPLLGVLPACQGKGIGSELVRRMLARLERYYMIDLVCDADMRSFYERFKMNLGTAMVVRHWEEQDGIPGRS